MLVGMFVAGMGAKFNKVVDLGDAAPGWEKLKGVDGQVYGLKDFEKAKVLVVMFTCNHCPMSRAYEARLKAFHEKFAPRGMALVAISVSQSPADNWDAMKEQAKRGEFEFPYVQDLSQQTARKLGALVTPQFFVFDAQRKLSYMGAFDNHLNSAQVEHHYLTDAVDALLSGSPVTVGESSPQGCHIEYEK